jgi:hypothetical protein
MFQASIKWLRFVALVPIALAGVSQMLHAHAHESFWCRSSLKKIRKVYNTTDRASGVCKSGISTSINYAREHWSFLPSCSFAATCERQNSIDSRRIFCGVLRQGVQTNYADIEASGSGAALPIANPQVLESSNTR